MNFLEQLIAEWYSYKGYLVGTNIRFGKMKQGGYEGEMDVIAFDPDTKTLIHIETSFDAESWEKRKLKFQKKFRTAERHYRSTFKFNFEKVVKRVIVGFTKSRKTINLGDDIELVFIPDIIREINEEMSKLNPLKSAIPERYPLLRTIQFSIFFGKK